MERHVDDLQEKLAQLLTEAAEVSVALDRANGTIQGVPHYSVIELRAHELGQELSRKIQQRHLRSHGHAAGRQGRMPRLWDLVSVAPGQTHGDLDRRGGRAPRTPWRLPELSSGLFPPPGDRWALTPANSTPVLVQRMTRTAAETRSFARAAIVMRRGGGRPRLGQDDRAGRA